MRVALARMAWNTGCSSPGELAMMRKHLIGSGLPLQSFTQLVLRQRELSVGLGV